MKISRFCLRIWARIELVVRLAPGYKYHGPLRFSTTPPTTSRPILKTETNLTWIQNLTTIHIPQTSPVDALAALLSFFLFSTSPNNHHHIMPVSCFSNIIAPWIKHWPCAHRCPVSAAPAARPTARKSGLFLGKTAMSVERLARSVNGPWTVKQ